MDTEIIGKQSRSKVRNYSINTVWDMKKGSVGPEMCGSLNRKVSLTLLILLCISAVILGGMDDGMAKSSFRKVGQGSYQL